jgi:hypothetical protein
MSFTECDNCNGTGSEECTYCAGTGETGSEVCPVCEGEKKEICTTCWGSGDLELPGGSRDEEAHLCWKEDDYI